MRILATFFSIFFALAISFAEPNFIVNGEIVTKKEYNIEEIKNANQFIKSRGPDKTNFVEWDCDEYKYHIQYKNNG